jgi:LCP family protein required for cell wall assembly
VAWLVDPAFLMAVLVGQAVLLAWRLVAVASVMGDRSLPRLGRPDALAVVVVVALVVLPQAGLGYVTNVAREATAEIFAPSIDEAFPSAEPVPSIAPPSPTDSSTRAASPSPSGTPAPPRTTVLLIGMDSGVGRHTASTDTMIVASFDPVARTVSMVSIPRDLVDAPLPKGQTFRPKINGLVAYVRWHPDEFPGYEGHGQAVLAWSLGAMLGVHIDYYAQVDLGGFVRVVDSVGGVDVNVARSLCDARYREYGFDGFSIGAGRHHMNGDTALAYARIRKSAGESDFTRAARQQQVIVALKDRLVKGGFLDDPIGLLRALGGTVQTNVPPAVVRDLAPFATQIASTSVFKAVVAHPLVGPGNDARGSIQIPDLPAIRALGAALFTSVGIVPAEMYATKPPTGVEKGPAQPAPRCSVPRPEPTPTPGPTPTSTAGETPPPTPTAGETPTPTPTAGETPTPTPTPTPVPIPEPTPTP